VLSVGGRAYHRAVTPAAPAFAIDLDGVLGDTRPLWRDWLADAARVLPVDVTALPVDRGEAAATLDAEAGNWRALLERYAEDRAPVYLRPDSGSSAALRRLAADGVRLGVFTDAPLELARIALAQLGAARRVTAVETGAGALDRLRAALGGTAEVLTTRDQLLAACV
jgi:phosphoglycolate phosphatase-like HAD superfamily hydrolase